MFRIAHISDLHLSKITFNPVQFFSKKWIANLNLILFRKKKFKKRKQLEDLPALFKRLKIDYLMVSGDISSTSSTFEFRKAKEILERSEAKIFYVPGNHDVYTKKSYRKKIFYDFFENPPPSLDVEKIFSLKRDKVEARYLQENFWYIGLDCSIPTPLLSSQGFFSKRTEENLSYLLNKIAKSENIILVCHFPFFRFEKPRKHLKGAKRLQGLIEKHPNIKFYLHGHSHTHIFSDLRANNLPIILDSGSSAHNEIASWNLIKIDDKKCDIIVYRWQQETWEKDRKILLSL